MININYTIKKIIKDYFWVSVGLFTTASVIFSGNQLWLVFFTILALFDLRRRNLLHLHNQYVFIIFVLLMITVLQGIRDSFYPLWTNIGILIRFSLPFFILLFYKKQYLKYFVSLLYIMTIINFIFYIPTLLIPGFYEMISKIPAVLGMDKYGQGITFLIYTAENAKRMGIFRDSGMFLEPGLHASYLMLGIIFNTFFNKNIINRKNILFSIAMFFTFSTAGYIFFILYIAFYIFIKSRNKLIISFVVIGVIFISYKFFMTQEFLGAKLVKQYNAMVVESRYGYGDGSERTVTLYNDFLASLDAPIIGLGRNEKTRYGFIDTHAFRKFSQSNTAFDIAASFGYLFFFLYFYFIFLSFYRLTKYYNVNNHYAWFFTLMIGLLYIPQTLYLHNSFLVLLYLNIFYRNGTNEKNSYNYSNPQ